jgi:two-component system NtrC family sensor kinase
MWNWRALIPNRSIKARLIAWFLLIALTPVAWTTAISYLVSKHILFNQATRNLQALIERQEKLLEYYFKEKKQDASNLLRDPTAVQTLKTLENLLANYGEESPEYQTARLHFYPILLFRMQALGYQNLWLVTKEGLVVFSINSSATIGQNIFNSEHFEVLKKIVEKSRETLDIQMTSLIFDRNTNSFTSFIAIPLLSPNDQFIGIAIVELNNHLIYHLLSGYNELGTFATLLIVTKMQDRLFIINPSRMEFQDSEEVDPYSPFGKFIQAALELSESVASHIEFHGQQNLMVGRHLKTALNWSLVTEVNEAMLLEPIRQLGYLFLILVPFTALAVTFAASNVAYKIASPILLLTKKTKILASGDLSQRITITSQDEIGKLGQSFNTMASTLHHLINHLDHLVAQRTEEYEVQNVKLEQTIKELRQTRDRLITQEKLASLGSLTAGIAHEIKNPLNFITNFAELSLQLQNDIELHLNSLRSFLSKNEQEELGKLLNTLKLNISKILEHGRRADSIIYNMLQHSRGTPGEKSLINIHKLLDEYINLAYHGMRAQDTSFNVRIEKQYDFSIRPISVVPQEISRVFLNLLNNAFYSINKKKKQPATPASYQPMVKIITEKKTQEIIISIWDNGLGIAPEVFPHLFTPFFSTKPPGEGTGLGLSLSYNIIVQGHGGMLSATSQLGEFAEFKITLPLE